MVFSSAGNDEALVVTRQGYTGLRFPDPLGRTDRAGRQITHEFVLWGGLGNGIDSVAAGREFVWPLVAAEYAGIWALPTPPD